MSQFDGRPLHLFCHLPKTGGTTVTRLLVESLGLRYVAARPVAKRTTYSPSDLRRDLRLAPWARCIGGHPLKPYVDIELTDRDLRWVTLLRDPIERYLSHYQHQYDRGHDRYHLPIDEWGRRFNRSDLMVRSIAGEANLERAKSILEERFDIVGTLESFDLFLIQLRESGLIQSYVDSPIRPSNVAPSTAAKDLVLQDWDRYGPFVHDANTLDIALYQYVTNRWSTATAQDRPLDGLQLPGTPLLPSRIASLSSKVFNHALLRPARRLEEARCALTNSEKL